MVTNAVFAFLKADSESLKTMIFFAMLLLVGRAIGWVWYNFYNANIIGVLINSGSKPTVKGNRVYSCGTSGIEVTNEASMLSQADELFI